MSNVGEFFGKYIGIIGIIALMFSAGYVVSPFAGVVLPAGYNEITLLIIGGFVGKNGGNIASRVGSFARKPGG